MEPSIPSMFMQSVPCPVILLPSLNSGNNSIMLIGPWGGEDGTHWSYKAIVTVTRISITSDADAIRSISFTSVDGYNNTDKSPVFGTATGTTKEIHIDRNVEKLVLMEGIVGTHKFKETVTQLSFTTSKNGVMTKHGPYGSEQKGSEFSCLLTEDPFAGFHGVCGESLYSIGVMVKSRESPSWGGEGGDPWSCNMPGTISRIAINYSDVIRAIRFTSVDESGRLEHSETFGELDSKDELEYQEIEIDTSTEKLNGITGTYGSHEYGIDEEATTITSLAFTTSNLRTFGTFGTRIGMPFEFQAKDDEVISGFYGRAGSLIDAIGVHKRSSKIGSNGVLIGPIGKGGGKWTYQPKGLITSIYLTYSAHERIYSIRFDSKDHLGKTDRSSTFGTDFPSYKTYEIKIDDAKMGKLNGISGTIVPSGQDQCVASLSFSTDKKIKYGPFGNLSAAGTKFSIKVKDGFFSGFHGSSSQYSINSIGVYVNST